MTTPDDMFARFFSLFALFSFFLTNPSQAQQITPIYAIQGTDADSPYIGQTVTTQGVVIGDFQAEDQLDGFFIQTVAGDGDATTSDGLFIYDPHGEDVSVGDWVRVTGRVKEHYGLTELVDVSQVQVFGQNNLPTTTIDLPLANGTNWEQFEGMLITIPEPLVVTDHYNLGRFGTLTLSADGRLFQPTNVIESADTSKVAELVEQNGRRTVLIDDGSMAQNPAELLVPFSAQQTVRGGDTVAGVTGVLHYAFDEYRLHLTQPLALKPTNPRPTSPPDVGGTLTVASFNVLNYFITLDNGSNDARGADSANEFERQRAKIITALAALDADIIGLMEVENNGYDERSAIADLVSALNEPPDTEYAFIRPPNNRLGDDSIAVGLLYRPAKVTPVGPSATLTAGPFSTRNRAPLAQTFEEVASGNRLTVVVNHFKSKGGQAPSAGDPNADQGDGQGAWNPLRVQAAQSLLAWLDNDPTASNSPHTLIIGDLNSYAREDPIRVLKLGGYTDLIQQFVGDGAYTYLFDGRWGYLDHALASSALTPHVTGTAIWHINADEPRILDYNEEFKSSAQVAEWYAPDVYRSSDHDPVLVGIALPLKAEGWYLPMIWKM